MKTLVTYISPVLFFAVLGFLAIAAGVNYGDRTSTGYIADAEKKLKPGQTYECVTSIVNVDDDGWRTIVKTEDEYFGLCFKTQPPIRGVVAKQKGIIIFLPLATSGITIPNPLNKPSVE